MKNRTLAWLASLYLRFIALTSRIVWINRSIRDELEEAGNGFIYAFWHGRQVFLVYLHKGDRIHPLISQSKDGDIIARVCGHFGLQTVRGSSSKGSVQALLKLKQVLESGDRIGVTPDGPRGPFRTVQAGVLYLAQTSGRPIVPVAYGAHRAWIFGKWDRFLIPKPFNRISMVYGAPLSIAPDDSLDAKAVELQAALDAVTQEADQMVGGCVGCP